MTPQEKPSKITQSKFNPSFQVNSNFIFYENMDAYQQTDEQLFYFTNNQKFANKTDERPWFTYQFDKRLRNNDNAHC